MFRFQVGKRKKGNSKGEKGYLLPGNESGAGKRTLSHVNEFQKKQKKKGGENSGGRQKESEEASREKKGG